MTLATTSATTSAIRGAAASSPGARLETVTERDSPRQILGAGIRGALGDRRIHLGAGGLAAGVGPGRDVGPHEAVVERETARDREDPVPQRRADGPRRAAIAPRRRKLAGRVPIAPGADRRSPQQRRHVRAPLGAREADGHRLGVVRRGGPRRSPPLDHRRSDRGMPHSFSSGDFLEFVAEPVGSVGIGCLMSTLSTGVLCAIKMPARSHVRRPPSDLDLPGPVSGAMRTVSATPRARRVPR